MPDPAKLTVDRSKWHDDGNPLPIKPAHPIDPDNPQRLTVAHPIDPANPPRLTVIRRPTWE